MTSSHLKFSVNIFQASILLQLVHNHVNNIQIYYFDTYICISLLNPLIAVTDI